MFHVKKYGDWDKVSKVLHGLSINIFPMFEAQISEDGELYLKVVREHIEAQDLDWEPLSERTVELKQGNETIYVDTGYLRDNLEVLKVKSDANSSTMFIGASEWKTTPKGEKFSDLMIWLEYGTDKMLPRPLLRPSWEEVSPIIKDNWRKLLEQLTKTGGIT